MTDGSGYRSTLHATTRQQAGIRPVRTRPQPTNGKAECFIQTVLREWGHPGMSALGNVPGALEKTRTSTTFVTRT